jgi:hypothetical protein
VVSSAVTAAAGPELTVEGVRTVELMANLVSNVVDPERVVDRLGRASDTLGLTGRADNTVASNTTTTGGVDVADIVRIGATSNPGVDVAGVSVEQTHGTVAQV